MKYIKRFEEKTIETAEDVVKRYCDLYPGYEDFFVDFLEYYPTYNDFNEEAYEYHDLDDYDEDEIYWTPEGEVYQLEQTVGNYPGSEIWVDFKNDMLGSTWDFDNTPLGKATNKYNL